MLLPNTTERPIPDYIQVIEVYSSRPYLTNLKNSDIEMKTSISNMDQLTVVAPQRIFKDQDPLKKQNTSHMDLKSQESRATITLALLVYALGAITNTC